MVKMVKKAQPKRGRPRKHGEREPNGRLRRGYKPRADPAQVALSARQRLFGLSAELARDEKAGSFLGRLCLSGKISREQYDAGRRFAILYIWYQRSVMSPGAVYDAPAPITGQTCGSREYFEQKAVCDYLAAAAALESANKITLNAFAAVRMIVLDGAEVPRLVPALIVGLNALEHFFQRK